MANKIQIKRSIANTTVIGLNPGELAYTANGNILYIGNPSDGSSIRIAGLQSPGTLTANQALVANSTSGIDKVIVANLVATNVWANGAAGVQGQFLTSNASGGIYWANGVAGTDTQIQFNDNGVLGGDPGLTYDKTSDTLSTNNVFVVSTVNAATFSVGSSFTANSTLVNAVSASVGGGVIANSSGIFPTSNSVGIGLGGANHRWFLLANGAGFSGNVLIQGTASINTLNVGSSAITGNSSKLVIGTGVGLEANGTIGNAGQVLHSNGTTIYWSNTVADITAVTAGDGLTGGGTSGDLTLNVVAGNGISVSSDAVAVNGGSTLTVNATGVHVNNTLSITSLTTSGDVTVNGNTKLGDASSDVVSFIASVNTNINPSANVTYSLGTNNLRWNEIHASNVHSTTGYFDGTVEIGGDLFVLGNVTTTNVSSVIVSDPMIYLAGNNYTSDLVDIGLAANYYDGATQRHTGLFRDASDDGIWKLFQGSEQELSGNNVVNTAANGFTLAILQAYLQSSALTTNATSVYVTANSTVNVNITANTLTLSSPLSGTSGGTGLNTFTVEDILVANSSNGFRKLGLGTDGYVLQSNGSALIYSTLDGGVF